MSTTDSGRRAPKKGAPETDRLRGTGKAGPGSAPGDNCAYLALGSNIRPEANLPAAVNLLAERGRVTAVSNVWESAAVGDPDQANFLNAAVLLNTPLSAEELKRTVLAEVERALGRVRDETNKNAPRTIDVDLVLFNREVRCLGTGRLPDPDILRRPFLAVPLAEIDPGYVHPADGRTLEEIARSVREQSPVLIARPDVRLICPA